MRRLLIIGSAAVLALALAAPVAARSYTVKVAGVAGWTMTFYVEGPATLAIASKGFVQTASVPAFLTHPATPGSGPAGQTWGQTCFEAIGPWYTVEEYGPCGVDDAYFGELIGRIGGGTAFAIGDATEIVVPDGVSGNLWLAVNDYAYTYADNSGQFSVTFR